jgi:hypothetical protein
MLVLLDLRVGALLPQMSVEKPGDFLKGFLGLGCGIVAVIMRVGLAFAHLQRRLDAPPATPSVFDYSRTTDR